MQWTIEPASPHVPIVACLPHGGLEDPPDLAGDLAMSPDELWSDMLTRELYDFLPELGITTITTNYSRFVADVNRDPDGDQHGEFRDSVVAAYLNSGRRLYRRTLTPEQISYRIGLAHEPFHRALDDAIGRLLSRYQRILLPHLPSSGINLAGDHIVGDRHGTTADPATTHRIQLALARTTGLDVRLNQRYIGGWTVKRFAAHDRVDAIAIEVNQRCYLDFSQRRYPAKPPIRDFDQTRRRLHLALQQIVTECSS